MAELELRGTVEIDARDFERFVLESVVRQFNEGVARAKGPIQRRVVEAIGSAIKSQPEHASLLNGRLKGELGVLDGEAATENVIAAIVRAMEVEVEPVAPRAGGFNGGLTISFSRKDCVDALSAAGVSYTSEGRYAGEVEWMRWLLLEGDRVILAQFAFMSGTTFRSSRTGMGIMRHSGTWVVPPEFAGTADSNWLTRAFSTMEEDIQRIFIEEMDRANSH